MAPFFFGAGSGLKTRRKFVGVGEAANLHAPHGSAPQLRLLLRKLSIAALRAAIGSWCSAAQRRCPGTKNNPTPDAYVARNAPTSPHRRLPSACAESLTFDVSDSSDSRSKEFALTFGAFLFWRRKFAVRSRSPEIHYTQNKVK